MKNFGKKLSTIRDDQGQVLLVVVLVMVVTLTVGLSVVSRSVTNLRNATDEEHSQKAFSAAEAGIEQSINATCTEQTGCTIADTFTENKAKFSAIAIPVSGKEFLLNGGNIVAKDDGVDLWLSDYSEDPLLIYQNPWSGNLTIYWGDTSMSDDCQQAALEVIIIYGPKTAPTSKRDTADPCSARKQANNFSPSSSGGGTIAGVAFKYKMTINLIENEVTKRALLARIVPLYTNAKIGVSGENALPSQGNIITSEGTSADTKRKIVLVRGYPGLPAEFFGYILFQTK